MKKFIPLLFPLFLFAENFAPITPPRLEEVVGEKRLIFAKSLPSALETTLRSLIAEERWHPFFQGESIHKSFEADVDSWILAHKFRVAYKREEPQEQIFDAKSDFVFFLKKWLPQLEQLPEELKGEFLSDVAERYLDIFPPDREGIIHFLVESVTLELENPIS